MVRKEVLTILQICRLISSLISSWTVRSSTGTPSLRNAHVGECFLCSDLKVPKTCGDTLDQTLQLHSQIWAVTSTDHGIISTQLRGLHYIYITTVINNNLYPIRLDPKLKRIKGSKEHLFIMCVCVIIK